MKHVELRQQGECLGYGAQLQRDVKSQLVLGVVSLLQRTPSTPDLDHTICTALRILPDYFFFFCCCVRTEEDAVSSLPVCFMPQLAADVPAQRKFGAKDGACQDRSGGHNLLNPGGRRFSSGSQKPPLHLPLWHDVETMSDSSPWTVLSNFSMPHFFSGARLRRSKRYHFTQLQTLCL